MTRNVGTFLRHLSLIFTNDKPVEMVLASDYDALAARLRMWQRWDSMADNAAYPHDRIDAFLSREDKT